MTSNREKAAASLILFLEEWRVVDAVLNAYEPMWIHEEIGDKHERRERMRQALVAAGLLTGARHP